MQERCFAARELRCRELRCRELRCRELRCRELRCRELRCRELRCRELRCRELRCERARDLRASSQWMTPAQTHRRWHPPTRWNRPLRSTAPRTRWRPRGGRVLAGWANDDRHATFINLCDALGRLDDAGARYRDVAHSTPERALDAQRYIGRVIARALVKLQVHRAPPSPKPRRALLLAAALLVGILFLATLWMLQLLGAASMPP